MAGTKPLSGNHGSCEFIGSRAHHTANRGGQCEHTANLGGQCEHIDHRQLAGLSRDFHGNGPNTSDGARHAQRPFN